MHIFRHFAQKFSDIRQYAEKFSEQTDEKSDGAICTSDLISASIDKICYRYDNNSPMVLKNLSLEFEAGKVYSIIGKSGAGKTTLLSILSSLAAPTSGSIYLNDEDIAKIDL